MAIEAMSFIVLEDGTRRKKVGELLTEGQAVLLNSDGELAAAAAASKVYGITKLSSNAFEDYSFGESGAFGSGQLTIITRGVMTIGQTVYNSTEIDSSTLPTATPTTVKVFDDSKTYAVGEPLYVDAAGLISNDGSGGKNSLLGKVLKTPVLLGSTSLELELDPGATSVAAELA